MDFLAFQILDQQKENLHTDTVQSHANIEVGVRAILAAGAIPITDPVVLLSVDGTKAYTLVDGQQAGQVLTIVCVAATNTPAGTLTPTNLNGHTNILFNAVGETATLMFHSGGWNIIATNGATPG